MQIDELENQEDNIIEFNAKTELEKRIEDLEKKIEDLESRLEDLEWRFE